MKHIVLFERRRRKHDIYYLKHDRHFVHVKQMQFYQINHTTDKENNINKTLSQYKSNKLTETDKNKIKIIDLRPKV